MSNSWSELVNTFINSEGLTKGVNLLNDLVQSATNLVEILTPLGAASLIGGGILSKNGIG